ncbi:tyrosine-type recombinase/integrase [Candidatus Methylospira mobilis]|uniref:tyrosine-type recombinase/integrase n=1 Tax=Candidatus Methylospira mobilis TaxID=1808979 RepID=UPI0028EA538E|nr:tyrosine-type recombinase/integrase [Candidatus Methylospira mobilis]WNV04197.1 tyrosine-type recombinase/integrase [Candidatus Methylospira mobilis]
MARMVRSSTIETREARLRIKEQANREPEWRQIVPGVFLGYRKAATGGAWIARVSAKFTGKTDGANYTKKVLGTADDFADSNGADILTYAEAITAAQAFAENLKQYDKPKDKYTVADAVKDYLSEHYAKEGRAITTTEGTYNAHILPQLGNKVIAELKTQHINKWLTDLAEAPKRNRGKLIEIDKTDEDEVRKRRASANRILTALKAALNHAYRAGRVASDDAWRRVSPFKRADAPKIRFLSTDECNRLLNAADPDFRPMVRAGLLTGCRYGELVKLKVSDFNESNGSIHIRISKGGKSRHVPLTGEGVEWFAEWTAGKAGNALVFTRPDGDAWGRSHQTRPMQEASDRAIIVPAVSFHILRHAYASLLVSTGVPLQVVADALGHADIRMTQRHYGHLQPSYAAEQIRANLPSFGAAEKKVTAIASRKKANA